MPLDICEGAQHIRAPRLRPLEKPVDWPPSARLRAYAHLASLRGHVRVGEGLWLMAEIELSREEEGR